MDLRQAIVTVVSGALLVLAVAAGAQEHPPVLGHAAPPRPDGTPGAETPGATPGTSRTPPPAAVEGMIERGAYLVKIAGCKDCHTPSRQGPDGPEPDPTRLLSGHPQDLRLPPPPASSEAWPTSISASNTAFAGSWGVVYATNLTPHRETGIGSWTEELFLETMRTGRHGGSGRELLPPMPWRNVAVLTDDDLSSIFRYLTSVPPVENRVPEPVPATTPGARLAAER